MKQQARKQQVQVCLGERALQLGELAYVKEGAREYSAFAYEPAWLAAAQRFAVSPDLPLVSGHQVHRAVAPNESVFHHALADTEPDAWGQRVIARAHAKARSTNPALAALTAFDTLAAVDDFSRVGALRLRSSDGSYLGHFNQAGPRTPPLVDLAQLLHASRAVEAGTDTAQDLAYLRGKGTSLGGMRPKCTLLDEDGSLALGKFPSLHDQRPIERGEVLAMLLATRAGIDAARARLVRVGDAPVAVITRFDRSAEHGRIPYLSAASMLLARRDEDRSYTELADAIRAQGAAPSADLAQLWRRLVFNLLISNVDDHLHNLGFLHVGWGQWRLAPSFDLNPFPDKDRESKTWLSESAGPITSLAMLMAHAAYFDLQPDQALAVLAQVHSAVGQWRQVASSAEVGLTFSEQDDFAPAFEHREMSAAKKLLG